MFDCYIRGVVEKGQLIFPADFCLTHNRPEDADKKALDEIQAELGPYLYAGNYFNNPVADDLVEFKDEWFQTYDINLVREKLRQARCYISIDPATRLKESNDPTGIVVTKVDVDGFVYVIDVRAKRLLPNELISEVFDLVEVYSPEKVIIETVSAQILWIDLFKQEMTRRKTRFVLEEYDPGTKETKAAKIRKLVPFYARGQVYHKAGMIELERQLREFPRNTHDDIIDALQAQIPFWKGTTVVQRKKLEPYSALWWDELRRRNKSNASTAEEKLFEEYRRKPSKGIIRRPSW